MEGPVRIILTSLLLFAYWPTAHANEPATIVAVEGAVTVHGQRSIDKRQASRGGRLDSASVISIPVGGMARLRFSDLRGIEYSLPPGTYTLTKARQLAQGARYSTFDRVKSFLHVTMGDQVSPIDAAAYLPVFTRSDEARFNIIWPAEWFGNTKPRLRYRDAGSAERRLEAVAPLSNAEKRHTMACLAHSNWFQRRYSNHSLETRAQVRPMDRLRASRLP